MPKEKLTLNGYSGEEVMEALENYINCASGERELKQAIEKGALRKWHNTLQQMFMRGMIKPCIKSLATDMYADARNQSSVDACKEMLPIVEKHYYPFI
jgi:hypothetical protein